MIILVTGSRHTRAEHQDYITRWLLVAAASSNQATVWGATYTLWHGDAAGVDTIAEQTATKLGWVIRKFPADWTQACRPVCNHGHRKAHRNGETYCPAAGVYRNQVMVERGPDIVVAFPRLPFSPGTEDCMARAWRAGIPLLVAPLPTV